MITLKEGIVFSNDIARILKGYNAINFSYNKNGILIPNDNFIESLRQDFETTVKRIFPSTTIVSEEEMLNSIDTSIKDVFKRYPHCHIR